MCSCKLTVVVLVYNLEKYLPKCLNALLAQTLEDMEILCVNDGSPDNSQEIIDRYVREHPDKIRSFVKPNGGEWSTRNYGLERARGEFITFVDNDDYAKKDWAEKLYAAAVKYQADLAVCAFARVNIDTGVVNAIDMHWKRSTPFEMVERENRGAFINPAPWNKIYRRSAVQSLRFLPLRGFSDMCFLMSAYLYIKRVVVIPDVLYVYNIRSTSQIHSLTLQDVENAKAALLSVKELYDKEPRGAELRPLLDFMAFIHLGISIMYRISYVVDKPGLKRIVDDSVVFLDQNFRTWRHSPFLKFHFAITKGLKYVIIWFVSILYRLHLGVLFLDVYRFIHDKLKIDAKW